MTTYKATLRRLGNPAGIAIDALIDAPDKGTLRIMLSLMVKDDIDVYIHPTETNGSFDYDEERL